MEQKLGRPVLTRLMTVAGLYRSVTSGLCYRDNIGVYEITCEHSAVCGYIFNNLEALLDERLDDEFHGIFKEGLNGKLEEEKEG